MALPDDDTSWIEQLETALLEECSATDIYCICKGKTLPENLRIDVWKICLDVRDKGDQLVHFNDVFDLANQNVLREDVKNFVAELGNDDDDKVSVVSDLESILTFYCKSRNVKYERGNGWMELLEPLIAQKTSRSVTFNLFEAIRDSYVPQGCSTTNGNAFHVLRLLLLYHDPELCSFLDTKRISPDSYCLKWFQSLFAATCSLDVVLAMWDFYFQQSDPFLVFFLALIMVVNAREQIMSLKSEKKDQIVNILSGMPTALEVEDVPDFCSLAQYYSMKTPVSFRSDLMQVLYGGASSSVSQALCLPVSASELIENINNVGGGRCLDSVRFFVVDCRPAEQYNAGHLPTAFHLDSNLMLQEPAAFSTAVQGLLSAQKQALAANSQAAGEHLCFLGSGRNEEDQYTHMVVASFLQKHTQYVSLLTGGYEAVHSYFESGDSVQNCLQDHDVTKCVVCKISTTVSSPQSSIKSTTNHSNSMDLLGMISNAMKNKSAEMKGKLIDYIVNPGAGSGGPGTDMHHVSADKNGKRYRNVAPVFSIDDEADNVAPLGRDDDEDEDGPIETVNLQAWLKDPQLVAHFKCKEVKMNGLMSDTYLLVTDTHLVVLKECPGNRGNAQVLVRRPLSAIVKITAKKRHPDLITFKYGVPDGDSLHISDMDRFLIPNASRATKIVSEQILKQLKTKESC